MRFQLVAALLIFPALMAAEEPSQQALPIPTYQEIPYYLRQLRETTVELKRVEINKTIHDAIVNADLADKKTAKKMEPIIAQVRIAMDSGLDRAYLEGSSMWLGSAVDYFDREKNLETVDIPESDWLEDQTKTQTGYITISPDKIWLIENAKNVLIAESSNMHEAVITPDGKRAAFVRQSNDGSRAEIWAVTTKNRVRKKIAAVPSVLTIVTSLEGDKIFIQEKPEDPDGEGQISYIGFSGGKPKKIGDARLLQTVVAKGKYKGALIVYKRRLHHLGTTYQECAYAWDENGRNLGRIKNMSCR